LDVHSDAAKARPKYLLDSMNAYYPLN